jgi:hypothetical protein
MQEKGRVFARSIAVKMSDWATTRIPVLAHAADMAVFVSAFLENSSARKAISAID